MRGIKTWLALLSVPALILFIVSACGDRGKEIRPSIDSAKWLAEVNVFPSGGNGLEGVLGSAYDSAKEGFIGGSCVGGETGADASEPTGRSEAGFTFQESLSEDQASKELGFGLDGRARYGVIEGSAAAKFLTNSVSNALSVSAIYVSSYLFPSEKLKNPTLNPLGTKLKGNQAWTKACGDEFVAEVVRGAKLFFSIRVDFGSLEQKKEFSAKFGISGPLAGVNAELSTASKSFNRNVKVTVSAYQLGGDVSKVTAIFDNSEAGQTSFVQCTLGRFEDCSKVIAKALKYATDTQTGFPSQLAPNASTKAAVLTYKTASYDAIGAGRTDYPGLSQAIRMARSDLNGLFDANYHFSVSANRLLKSLSLAPDRRAALESNLAKVNGNLRALLAASQTCYETPMACPGLVPSQLKLQPFDDRLLVPETLLELCAKADELAVDDPLRATFEVLRSLSRYDLKTKLPTCAQLKDWSKTATNVTIDPQINGVKGIVDLRPLSEFTELTELMVNSQKVVDLSPLATLGNLKLLYLTYNRIVDIEPLSQLTELRTIALSYNRIVDVSPLAGLDRLEHIYLNNNRIHDVSALKSFPHLNWIDLNNNMASHDELKAFISRMPRTSSVSADGHPVYAK